MCRAKQCIAGWFHFSLMCAEESTINDDTIWQHRRKTIGKKKQRPQLFLQIRTYELGTEAGPGPEWSPCSAGTAHTAGGRCWKSQAARVPPSAGWAACQLSLCCSSGPDLTLWSHWSDAVSGTHKSQFHKHLYNSFSLEIPVFPKRWRPFISTGGLVRW